MTICPRPRDQHYLTRLTRRMNLGSVDGRSDAATPAPTAPLTGYLPSAGLHLPVANAGAGPSAGQDSTPFTMPYAGQVTAVELHSGATTVGASTFRIRVNGALVGGTVTLPAGAAQSVFDPTVGPIPVSPGDVVRLACITADGSLGDFGGYIAVQV